MMIGARLAGVMVTCLLIASGDVLGRAAEFVEVRGAEFRLGRRQHMFVGTNYWYGSLLGLETDRSRGIRRLRKELDFLRSQGVTNLRLMAGAEGSGPMNGVLRVGPPLQPTAGVFYERTLKGLDIVLDEMSKRQMKAVIFLSNNWEWSGGFQQYLIWNNKIPDLWLTKKPDWDELRDITSQFYSCKACIDQYHRHVEYVLGRRNRINGRRYTADPTIMAWELANEPRPMRPAANDAYRTWIADTARLIKGRTPRQLITIGHEGWIGTTDIALFEAIHADPNVDYVTIHIWPKNWGWFADGKLAEGFDEALRQTIKYIEENSAVATRLGKPLVIEEFGLPRDRQSFDPAAATTLRDRYYEVVLSFIGRHAIKGANFWAFGGTARPKSGRIHWQPGDEYMGDPPMEEQGLNSVFDSDTSTWRVIRTAARRVRLTPQSGPK